MSTGYPDMFCSPKTVNGGNIHLIASMRNELKSINGKRITVFGTVGRFGKKSAYKGPPIETVCLVDLVDKDKAPICDHLWIIVGKQVAALKLQEGDRICFTGRVKKYLKGYKGRREDVDKPLEYDYKLSHPSKFSKLNRGNGCLPGKLF